MTNFDMRLLIKSRTEAFYERILKPFELCQESDIGWIKNALESLFNESRNHSDWFFWFITEIDKLETGIALHRRKPAAVKEEIESLIGKVLEAVKKDSANCGRI